MDLINILDSTDLCTSSTGQRLFGFIGYLLTFIQIAVPIILILMGTFDFVRALVSQKDDEIKKSQSRFIKRIIIGVVIFFIPLIIKFITGMVAGDDFSKSPCLSCLSNPTKCTENAQKLEEQKEKDSKNVDLDCPDGYVIQLLPEWDSSINPNKEDYEKGSVVGKDGKRYTCGIEY